MAAAWLALLTPALASAQPVAVVVEDGATEAAVRRWRDRVASALPREPVALEAWAERSEPAGTVAPVRLQVLDRIEALIVGARDDAAHLRERAALVSLSRARGLAERNLDVPGMAAWYAEVQLAVAITAAQAGQGRLSEAALRRGASIDPERGVRMAEAGPEVVASSARIARAAATAPTGRFDVRADAPGAVVWLDDRPVGSAPLRVEAPVGPHVLRVDAPGRRGWAAVVDVLEGERPAVEVVLAPTARVTASRALEAAARAGDLPSVESALAAIGGAPELYVVAIGPGPLDRALLYACRPGRCAGPRLLEGAPRAPLGPDLEAELAHAEAQRWLAEAPARAPPEPAWYERWEPWTAAGVIVAGAVAAAVTAALLEAQPAEPPLILHVDPRPLPTAGD